jgi:RTX calcium-binding nonapeptide repeat (4 copies)
LGTDLAKIFLAAKTPFGGFSIMPASPNTITGTHDDDVLLGTDLADVILGSCGDDWIFGKNGPDRLLGGWGNDSIAGGDGDDTVAGGLGSNELAGGWGADTFVVQSGGFQRIVDFDLFDSDKITIHDAAFLNPDGTANLDALMVQDIGYDLVLLGQVDNEYQVLARIDWWAGLSLYDILEPSLFGDVPGNASTEETLVLGDTVSGEFEFTYDADWYRFDTEAATFYAFTYAPDAASDNPASYGYLDLLDADGNYVDIAYFEYTDESVTLYYQSDAAETLFVAATEDAFDTGDYLLSVVETVNPDTVPNNTGTTAELALGTPVTGEFDYTGDADWYAFEASAGTFYSFTYTPDAASNDPSSYGYLEVFDAAGEYLSGAFSDYPEETVTLDFVAGEDGVIYVSAADNYSSTGSYILTAEAHPNPDTVPGDTSTTETIPVGGQAAGDVDYAEDSDWFAIELVAGESYIFRLESDESSAEPLGDPYLFLYDATGAYITENDDSSDSPNSRIDHLADVDGIVYASAEGFGSAIGDYVLSVELA